MIIRDSYREPRSRKVYQPTGKDVEYLGTMDQPYWVLSGKVEEALGPEGGTIGDIYDQVTRPLGLSLDDTRQLVKTAVIRGYLR